MGVVLGGRGLESGGRGGKRGRGGSDVGGKGRWRMGRRGMLCEEADETWMVEEGLERLQGLVAPRLPELPVPQLLRQVRLPHLPAAKALWMKARLIVGAPVRLLPPDDGGGAEVGDGAADASPAQALRPPLRLPRRRPRHPPPPSPASAQARSSSVAHGLRKSSVIRQSIFGSFL